MRKTTLLLAALAILILLLVTARFYFSEADYALQNYNWNGYSQLSSAANVKPLYDIADLPASGSGDTLLIVSPATNYTAEESSRVQSFLRGGGKVVVMDDFGKADSLLDGMGAPITINPVLLCQYEDYYTNYTFPVITNVTSSDITGNVKKIVLDYPAALDVTGNAEVIASSSSKGWLDSNANMTLDDDELMGVYPVVARTTDLGGELLVISDPDIFINSMLDKGDNRVLLSSVLAGNVQMDVSHGRGLTPLGTVLYLVRYNLYVQVAAAFLVLCGFLAYVARTDILKIMRGRKNGR